MTSEIALWPLSILVDEPGVSYVIQQKIATGDSSLTELLYSLLLHIKNTWDIDYTERQKLTGLISHKKYKNSHAFFL